MAVPRKASPKESQENKRKQSYLKSHGYPDLVVDGSWGPWQEQAWIKATTRQKQYPVSPWGLIQRGWDNLTGNTTYVVEHPEGEIRQAPTKNNMSLATGALALGSRDPRAIIATIPLAIGSALWLGNGPEIMKTVSEVGQDLKQGVQRTYNRLASYFYPIESTNTEESNTSTPSDTTTTAAPGAPQPERNDSTSQRRPSPRKRLGNRTAGRGNRTTNNGSTSPNNQTGSFLKRMLWETENNNFGQNWWQWRNVGRVGLGASYPARKHLWPAVGRGIKYMAVGPDSVSVATAQPVITQVQTPVDSSYISKDQYIAPTDTLDF